MEGPISFEAESKTEGEREKSYCLLHFAAVHYVHHVINGDAGLGNVGSNHNLPHSLRGTIKHLWGGEGGRGGRY